MNTHLIKNDLREMFRLLDYTEESLEGRAHKPLTFVCTRNMMLEQFNLILIRLKEYAFSDEQTDQAHTMPGVRE